MYVHYLKDLSIIGNYAERRDNTGIERVSCIAYRVENMNILSIVNKASGFRSNESGIQCK